MIIYFKVGLKPCVKYVGISSLLSIKNVPVTGTLLSLHIITTLLEYSNYSTFLGVKTARNRPIFGHSNGHKTDTKTATKRTLKRPKNGHQNGHETDNGSFLLV